MDLRLQLHAAVDALADAIEAARATNVTEYTSACPPHRTTARTFARWCRSGRVRGARRDGAGWVCTVEAWRAARSKGPARETSKAAPANDVDGMLAAAGLRRTARAAR